MSIGAKIVPKIVWISKKRLFFSDFGVHFLGCYVLCWLAAKIAKHYLCLEGRKKTDIFMHIVCGLWFVFWVFGTDANALKMLVWFPCLWRVVWGVLFLCIWVWKVYFGVGPKEPPAPPHLTHPFLVVVCLVFSVVLDFWLFLIVFCLCLLECCWCCVLRVFVCLFVGLSLLLCLLLFVLVCFYWSASHCLCFLLVFFLLCSLCLLERFNAVIVCFSLFVLFVCLFVFLSVCFENNVFPEILVICWFYIGSMLVFFIFLFGSCLLCLFSLLLPILRVLFLFQNTREDILFSALFFFSWFLVVLFFFWNLYFWCLAACQKATLQKRGIPPSEKCKMHKKGHVDKVQLVQLSPQIVFCFFWGVSLKFAFSENL